MLNNIQSSGSTRLVDGSDSFNRSMNNQGGHHEMVDQIATVSPAVVAIPINIAEAPMKHNHRIKFLKIKLKTLAAESHFIKLEKNRKVKRMTPERIAFKDQLNLHRVNIVRPEARATLMAYGLLRGKTAEMVEPRAKTEPDWTRVNAMIKKYGTVEDQAKLKAAA